MHLKIFYFLFLYYNKDGDIMKKLFILIFILLTITGCTKEEITNKEQKVENPKEVEEVEIYQDENTTPISIYQLNNNTLKKLDTIEKTLNVEEDIGIFQIYPSTENTISLNKNYGQVFYDEWIKYKNIKLGFNIKYTLKNNETTSYNIFSPKETFDHWEYLMNYLYDDFNNQHKYFYSHLEDKDMNESTVITSIKLQAAYKCREITNIKLTVFTYDSEDDFLDNEYRGNSQSTMTINIK